MRGSQDIITVPVPPTSQVSLFTAQSAPLEALRARNLTRLDELLSRASSLDTQDSQGKALVHRAVEMRYLEGVECILEQGA